MAAPYKQGLDYFPFSVDLLRDSKLRPVRREFGYLAQMVYIAALSVIYADKGYYAEYSDDFIWTIEEMLSGGQYPPSGSAVRRIIERMAACELFSTEMLSGAVSGRKIITSKRIQEIFYKSTVERKKMDIDFDIWILTREDMEAISARSRILHFFINRSINSVNRSINGVNQPINEQRKEKEKKRERKEREKESGEAAARAYGIFKNVFLDDGQYAELKRSISNADDKINKLSVYMESSGKSYKNHYAAILKWTREDEQRAKNAGKGFNNFTQPDYDFEAMENKALGRSVKKSE